jgi:hypothetical protein
MSKDFYIKKKKNWFHTSNLFLVIFVEAHASGFKEEFCQENPTQQLRGG